MKHVSIMLCIMCLLLSTYALAITPSEFNTLVPGSIVYLKVEWNGKVYLEGQAVVAYTIGESAQLASTNPTNNFSGAFHMSFIQSIVKTNNNTSLAAENDQLRQRVAVLTNIINKMIGDLISIVDRYRWF